MNACPDRPHRISAEDLRHTKAVDHDRGRWYSPARERAVRAQRRGRHRALWFALGGLIAFGGATLGIVGADSSTQPSVPSYLEIGAGRPPASSNVAPHGGTRLATVSAPRSGPGPSTPGPVGQGGVRSSSAVQVVRSDGTGEDATSSKVTALDGSHTRAVAYQATIVRSKAQITTEDGLQRDGHGTSSGGLRRQGDD